MIIIATPVICTGLAQAAPTDIMAVLWATMPASIARQVTSARRGAGGSIELLRTGRVLEQLRKVALGATEEGIPIYLANVAQVRTGPNVRHGIAEWNGQGETVGVVVVMRFGENAQRMIERVREKLVELEKGLPPGVGIEVGYD